MSDLTAGLIDMAVNLTDTTFAPDLEAVLTRATEAGIDKILVTASSWEESEAALALCRRFPQQLYCTAGTHPHHAKDWQHGDLSRLRQLCDQPQVVAIGEAGLDFNRDFSPRPQQIEVFEQQLQLAAETGMPILMHERDAHRCFIDRVRSHRDQLGNALLHCFTGNREELFHCLELDLYIGITGWACDERRGGHLLELIKEIPAERLLLETDAPYLLPRTLRPKPKSRRNEPAHLAHICEVLAAALGTSPARLAEQTSANARRFLRLES